MAVFPTNIYNYNDSETLAATAAVLHLSEHYSRTGDLNSLQEEAEHMVCAHPDSVLVRNCVNTFLFGCPADQSYSCRAIAVSNFLAESKEKATAYCREKFLRSSKVFAYSVNSEMLGILDSIGKEYSLNFVLSSIDSGMIEALPAQLSRTRFRILKDIELKEAIVRSDICLLWPHAISKEGNGIAKKGSSLCADICRMHHVPLYLLAYSFKFDAVNQHKRAGVYFSKIFGSGAAEQAEYDTISKEDITGIISDKGILKPDQFAAEIRRDHPWLFP
jgi:hypothetical protein